MKNFCKAFVTLCAVMGLLALTGCPGVFTPPSTETAGGLTITVNGAGGRTVLPNPVFDKYELTFEFAGDVETGETAPTHDPVDIDLGNIVVIDDLEEGDTWKITAKGYVTIGTGTEAKTGVAAEGSVTVTLTDQPQVVDITISASIDDAVDGTFTYEVTFPDFVTTGELVIGLFDGNDTPVTQDLTTAGNDTGSIDLPSGYYLLTVALASADGREAGVAEIVHIYPNMETKWEYDFDEDDFDYVLAAAIAGDVTVTAETDNANGFGGAEPQDVIIVTINLTHATVAAALTDVDAHLWFTPHVAGLNYVANAAAGAGTITITIDGEPTEIPDITTATITIPAAELRTVVGTTPSQPVTVSGGDILYVITQAADSPITAFVFTPKADLVIGTPKTDQNGTYAGEIVGSFSGEVGGFGSYTYELVAITELDAEEQEDFTDEDTDNDLFIIEAGSVDLKVGEAALSASGTYKVLVKITDSAPVAQSLVKAFILEVTYPPTITTAASLPSGIEGEAYTITLEADGDTPITWEVTIGRLHTGLTLDQDTGVISGEPEEKGELTFTVTATNDDGTDSKEFTLEIMELTPGETGIDVGFEGYPTEGFTLQADTVEAGTEVAIIGDGFDDLPVVWYLDGKVVANHSGDSIIITETMLGTKLGGTHIVTAVVVKDNVYYSAFVKF